MAAGVGHTGAPRKRIRDANSARPWRIACLLLLAAALTLGCYPFASDAVARLRAERSFCSYTGTLDPARSPESAATLQRARAYNEAWSLGDGGKLQGYEGQLVTAGRQEMAWLEIPRIGVKVPVYHGTTEAVLMAGAGHLEESALPVGGAGCHCVITGHSGMRGVRMFDYLDQLEVGDLFVVWAAGAPCAYRVTGTQTVRPEETEGLRPQQGRDLCTLVTCTSSEGFSALGERANDRRLLVQGERCSYNASETSVPLTANLQDRSMLACACIATTIALTAISRHATRRVRLSKKREVHT